MLVLSRKLGERIVVGDGVTVTLVAIEPGRVRVGIAAPHWIGVTRPAPGRRKAAGGLPKKG